MIGERLGPCRLVSQLGAGGMGTVFAATVEQPVGGLLVGSDAAVKVLHPHLVGTDRFTERFLREAQLGRSIRHANVVRTLDAGCVTLHEKQTHFLVMERVDGQTLRQLLAEICPLPEELCRHIAVQVTEGLAAIHAAGALHRDIKPENVLITPDHHVKLMDLGVARLMDESVRLSRSGAFVGSLHYAAPEAFRKELGPVDQRADLHAVGLLLHEIATGNAPYAAQEMSECIRRLLEVAPRPVGELNPQLSPFFEELVAALLQKRPARRPESAAALRTILEEADGGSWWRTRAAEIRRETRRPLRRIRVRRESAVHGRETELAELRAAFECAKSGDGRVILIEGETGIGKSRLVDELVRRLTETDEDVDFLFGSYPPGRAAALDGAFSTAYREYLGAEDLETTLRSMLGSSSSMVPAFTALLRGDSSPRESEQLSQAALATMFLRVTRAIAATRPAIVLIDDLHNAPDEALALFAGLAHGLVDDRVLLIGTSRTLGDGDRLAEIAQMAAVQRIRLARLGPRDLAAVLRDALKSRMLAGELNIQISERTDGNPYFLFAFLDELRRTGRLVPTDDGSWDSPSTLQCVEVPESVRDLIRARVAALDEEQRAFAEVASCCGFRFDPTLVAQVLELPLLPALKLCGRMELQHGLIRAVGREYEFDHHQVQEVLYSSVFETLREHYHGALGTALQARLGGERPTPAQAHALSSQFLRAGDIGRARPYVIDALLFLSRSHVHAELVEMARRALELDDSGDATWRIQLMERKAYAEGILASPDERATLEEALAVAEGVGDPGCIASVLALLGFHRLTVGETAAAAEDLERALTYAESQDRRAVLGNVLRSIGTAYTRLGRYDEAKTHLQRAIDLARRSGSPGREAGDVMNLAIAYGNAGDQEREHELHRRALELALQSGERRWQANAYANLGRRLHAEGRLAEALELAERFRELTHEYGERRNEMAAAVMLATTFITCGALEEAERELGTAKRLAREVCTPYFEAFAVAAFGEVAAHRGDHESAAAEFERAMSIRSRIGERAAAAYTQVDLAECLRELGQASEAERLLVQVGDVADEIGDDELRADAYLLRACMDDVHREDALAAHARVTTAITGDREIEWALRLYELTGDAEQIRHARARVLFRRDHAPPRFREPILVRHALHRRVIAAAHAAGLD